MNFIVFYCESGYRLGGLDRIDGLGGLDRIDELGT
jgi:hypothetical protein